MEYIQWNQTCGYTDEHVTPAKMVLFLTQVQDRPVRSTSRKQATRPSDSQQAVDQLACEHADGSTTEGEGSGRIIGYHTLAAYANALMDIWKFQFDLKQNPLTPIRPASVKELLKQKKMAVVQKENTEFADRGRGTMADCVDPAALRQISDKFFMDGTEQGLKHRADNLMSLALCTRGDNLRRLTLSEIGLRYYLPRDLIKPPDDVLNQVFPSLEESSLSMVRAAQTEIAGTSFVSLLKYMRTVLLQDVAVLMTMEAYKDHPMFSHGVFQDQRFIDFKTRLADKISRTPTPESLLLHQAMPLLAENIQDMRNESVLIHRELTAMNSRLDNVTQAISTASDLSAGAITSVRQDMANTLFSAAQSIFPQTSPTSQANAGDRAQHLRSFCDELKKVIAEHHASRRNLEDILRQYTTA
ncbi:hypothetical protein DYB30_011413 [Aphanomyces astaci]|uniref:Ndc10 domain-containing protein n=2 Tax=Aphanomyces astaci TaxID=112090 RepID=A0A397AMD1_APHAT|nr:hypothetical protein DYB36_006960 [Aphanomyces astaci]RHY42980.1 hypothetical protein DYB34_004416 [Aphanomyces astaci]RHY48560.1 hypothetical protein DYB30_011413 [Aphanomyces astaci]